MNVRVREGVLRQARNIVVILLLSNILAVASIAFFPKHFKDATKITAEGELLVSDARIEQGVVIWIDARSGEKYASGHITKAIHLNEEEWDKGFPRLMEVWDAGTPIVIYCESGCHSSYKVANKLRSMGFDPVFVLKGGWQAWRAQHE